MPSKGLRFAENSGTTAWIILLTILSYRVSNGTGSVRITDGSETISFWLELQVKKWRNSTLNGR